MELSLFKYNKTEIDKLMKSLTILIDTREQQNKHITEFFDKHSINYKSATLPFGDYSFMIPASPELGIDRDIYFNKHIAIERKGSLEELSGNFAQKRTEFENEFMRSTSHDCKVILLIENAQLENIYKHSYRTEMSEKAYIASLITFSHRYNVHVSFISKEYAGQYIFSTLFYYLKEYLK